MDLVAFKSEAVQNVLCIVSREVDPIIRHLGGGVGADVGSVRRKNDHLPGGEKIDLSLRKDADAAVHAVLQIEVLAPSFVCRFIGAVDF